MFVTEAWKYNRIWSIENMILSWKCHRSCRGIISLFEMALIMTDFNNVGKYGKISIAGKMWWMDTRNNEAIDKTC